MNEDQARNFRKLLEEERANIERQLSDYGASASGEGIDVKVDEGFADSAQATAERSEVLSHVEKLQLAHGEVLEAFGRIDRGTYGKCERCGQDIPPERLEARPTARLCISCQEATAR